VPLSPVSILFPLPEEPRTRVLLAGVVPPALVQLAAKVSSTSQGVANALGVSFLLDMRRQKDMKKKAFALT
jgi:hypothetical protein